MIVEESHGIFQFTDDYFENEQDNSVRLNHALNSDYVPRRVDEGWFMHESLSQTDHAIIKCRLDYLYFEKKYEEAFEIANSFLQSETNPKREIVETALLVSLRLQRREKTIELLDKLEGLGKEDHGIRLVCEYARRQLFPENITNAWNSLLSTFPTVL